jgi:hypothetical protein
MTRLWPLIRLYEKAMSQGLKCNDLVMKDLLHLSELHKIHYARFTQIEARAVALIGQFDDMMDQLFADVSGAFCTLGR